jgi:hypothetical protein
MARRVWPAGQRLGGFKDASPRPLPVGRAGSAAEWRLGVDFCRSASEQQRHWNGRTRPARVPPICGIRDGRRRDLLVLVGPTFKPHRAVLQLATQSSRAPENQNRLSYQGLRVFVCRLAELLPDVYQAVRCPCSLGFGLRR